MDPSLFVDGVHRICSHCQVVVAEFPNEFLPLLQYELGIGDDGIGSLQSKLRSLYTKAAESTRTDEERSLTKDHIDRFMNKFKTLEQQMLLGIDPNNNNNNIYNNIYYNNIYKKKKKNGGDATMISKTAAAPDRNHFHQHRTDSRTGDRRRHKDDDSYNCYDDGAYMYDQCAKHPRRDSSAHDEKQQDYCDDYYRRDTRQSPPTQSFHDGGQQQQHDQQHRGGADSYYHHHHHNNNTNDNEHHHHSSQASLPRTDRNYDDDDDDNTIDNDHPSSSLASIVHHNTCSIIDNINNDRYFHYDASVVVQQTAIGDSCGGDAVRDIRHNTHAAATTITTANEQQQQQRKQRRSIDQVITILKSPVYSGRQLTPDDIDCLGYPPFVWADKAPNNNKLSCTVCQTQVSQHSNNVHQHLVGSKHRENCRRNNINNNDQQLDNKNHKRKASSSSFLDDNMSRWMSHHDQVRDNITNNMAQQNTTTTTSEGSAHNRTSTSTFTMALQALKVQAAQVSAHGPAATTTNENDQVSTLNQQDTAWTIQFLGKRNRKIGQDDIARMRYPTLAYRNDDGQVECTICDVKLGTHSGLVRSHLGGQRHAKSIQQHQLSWRPTTAASSNNITMTTTGLHVGQLDTGTDEPSSTLLLNSAGSGATVHHNDGAMSHRCCDESSSSVRHNNDSDAISIINDGVVSANGGERSKNDCLLELPSALVNGIRLTDTIGGSAQQQRFGPDLDEFGDPTELTNQGSSEGELFEGETLHRGFSTVDPELDLLSGGRNGIIPTAALLVDLDKFKIPDLGDLKKDKDDTSFLLKEDTESDPSDRDRTFYGLMRNKRPATTVSFRRLILGMDLGQYAQTRLARWEPFWKIETVVSEGVTSPIASTAPNVTTIHTATEIVFRLTKRVLGGTNYREIIKQTGKIPGPENDKVLDIMLWMLPVEPLPGKADCHLWPKGTFLQINSKPVRLQQRHEYMKDKWNGHCVPLKLAEYVSEPTKDQKIQLSSVENTTYLFVVALCRYQSKERLYLTLQHEAAVLPSHEGLKRAMEMAAAMDHDFVSLDNELTFRLTCPLTKSLLTTPVRGKRCDHFQVSFWLLLQNP